MQQMMRRSPKGRNSNGTARGSTGSAGSSSSSLANATNGGSSHNMGVGMGGGNTAITSVDSMTNMYMDRSSTVSPSLHTLNGLTPPASPSELHPMGVNRETEEFFKMALQETRVKQEAKAAAAAMASQQPQ
jgi:hypothetical protein